MNWEWEKRGDAEYTPPNMSTIYAGWDISRKKSELASQESIPANTEVFVRELVQNFVDASREDYAPGVKPRLVLRFLKLTGEEAIKLSNNLSLQDISSHYSELSKEAKGAMRLDDSDLVSGKLSSIRLLVATETGTSGMYGQWERSSQKRDSSGREIKNKMRDALISHVRDSASAGKGLGSYGEGKKAVIGISAARTILTYTCFQPDSSADGVHSRLLGSTYWENHSSETTKFTGMAMFGKSTPGGIRPAPFVDSEADVLVNSLGIPGLESRKLGAQLDTGTTMVFFEPKAKPEDVAASIARNWWPLMENEGADFEVIDEDGEQVPITTNESLEPFISAYRQTQSQEIKSWETANGASYVQTSVSTSEIPSAGRLVLGIDLRPGLGFSHANPEKNWSLVALIRDGMIVAYQPFPKNARDHVPFVRAIFEVTNEAHAESAALLRKIEPPLHNQWPEVNNGLDEATVKHSKQIIAAIKQNVDKFRKEHMGKLPEMEQDLPLFRNLLGIKGGSSISKPPKPTLSRSPVELLSAEAEITEGKSPGSRVANSSRIIRIRQAEQIDELRVSVRIGWEILEDGDWVEASTRLFGEMTSTPEGFSSTKGSPNVFKGTLSKGDSRFEWDSREYFDLWTLRPFMSVEGTDEEAE
jgi:hypothetical protein